MRQLRGYDFVNGNASTDERDMQPTQSKRLQRLILFLLPFIQMIKAKLSVFNLSLTILTLPLKARTLKHIPWWNSNENLKQIHPYHCY
jgi:hypothetical protein